MKPELATPPPDTVQQPGPVADTRYSCAPTRLEDMDFEVQPGISLHDALAQEITRRGLAGAFIRIINAGMSELNYVIPALSPDDEHVAWYSETRTPLMPGKIEDAGIICGSLSENPFYHCHGRMRDADGTMTMGHLLPESCSVANPVRVTGFGFKDARFDRKPDPETNFELFTPVRLTSETTENQGILLRIAPNTQISQPLIECCQNAGWKRTSVHGVGSLIGAHFADGSAMNSYATEFLITKGSVDLAGPEPHVALDIVIVGLDAHVMQGRLSPQNNPVLITSEILLKNQSDSHGA